MQKRKLGKSELEVSPLCLGGNVFGWTVDEKTSFQLLDAFVEAGGDFIDTADVYSAWIPGNKGGESETIIGKWFKQSGKRNKVVIATKVGLPMGPDKQGLSKAYIRSEVEESLERLQTDHIDLYQSHKDDPDTPQEETLEAFGELVKAGKVRVIGASNYSADRLKSALQISQTQGYPRYESLQPQYNLYDREGFEKELQPVCEKNGIGVIPYYSLAAGFLTGKYRSEADLGNKARAGTVKKYLDERGRRILAALDKVVKELNSTPAKISLAWLKSRSTITAPIASATNLDQLKDLLDAANLELPPAVIEELNRASA